MFCTWCNNCCASMDDSPIILYTLSCLTRQNLCPSHFKFGEFRSRSDLTCLMPQLCVNMCAFGRKVNFTWDRRTIANYKSHEETGRQTERMQHVTRTTFKSATLLDQSYCSNRKLSGFILETVPLYSWPFSQQNFQISGKNSNQNCTNA
jgi:hypothetical protein